MEYFEGLGKLLANMQSLEFVLRAFLVNNEIAEGISFPQSTNLLEMKEGDIVPENAFTNYDNLRQLIKKYNNNSKILSSGLVIDETLVNIRDAIAHGRVSAANPSSSLRLLKFDKPKNNQVKVTFSVSVTKEWFNQQISRVHRAILTVTEANERLQRSR